MVKKIRNPKQTKPGNGGLICPQELVRNAVVYALGVPVGDIDESFAVDLEAMDLDKFHNYMYGVSHRTKEPNPELQGLTREAKFAWAVDVIDKLLRINEKSDPAKENCLIEDAKKAFYSALETALQASTTPCLHPEHSTGKHACRAVNDETISRLFLTQAWELIGMGEVNAARRFLREEASGLFAGLSLKNTDEHAYDVAEWFKQIADIPLLQMRHYEDFFREGGERFVN